MTQRRQSPRLTRRALLTGGAAAAVGAGLRLRAAPPEDAARRSLAAAVEYLWSMQADDGGWHSSQYGLMRSGQSLTPFVLHALLGTIASMASDEYGRIQRAGRFLLTRCDEEGVLGRHDPEVVEYPVYSTAYALQSFRRMQGYRRMLGPEGDRAIDRMQRYLAAAQFDEADGFAPEDAAYGGWGFQAALAPGRSGHMDLAHTRRALDALDLRRRTDVDAAVASEKAQSFLRLVQKHPQATAQHHFDAGAPASVTAPFDGGFYFSPVVLDANKGRIDDDPAPHWRSYATATCDGLLALLAAGVPSDDERVTAAVGWLRRNSNPDYPQGVPTDYPEPWGAAIRFYHYAVRGEVYRQLDWPAHERAVLATSLCAQQEADGSFINVESPLMKEDDPVLCTALAVVALSNCV